MPKRLTPLHAALVTTAALAVACSIAASDDVSWRSLRGVDLAPPMLQAAAMRIPDPGPCPPEMAFVAEKRFCVDRWEAHVEVEKDGAWTVHAPNEPLDGIALPFRAASSAGVVPQAYVSGEQAAQACGAAGKRLCKLDEYRLACGGPEQALYPYGGKRVAGACNDDRGRHPFADVFGSNAPEMFDHSHLNDPRIDLLPGTVLPAGSKPACVSPYGAYDMVGNLHEWVDDPDGTFAGGYYNDAEINGPGCRYTTTAHTFDYHDYSTGFRCCADAR